MMEEKDFNKEFGKYFLDVSKLILGGVVLATIIKIENINKGLVLFSGVVAAFLFALYGFRKLKK